MLSLDPKQTPQADKVHALVRKYGVMGGKKGFLYAYVKADKLHLVLQEPTPRTGHYSHSAQSRV